MPSEPAIADVRASEAGALFAARAADARRGFRLDETTAPAVQRICRRLDGIPLAIELVSVRMASMSAVDLADGLDDRFHLLTSGKRTALPRHYEVGSHTRYRLLETVRAYERDRLGDEVDAVTRRYCAWVAGLVETVGANAQVDTATWYGLLDREFLHVQGAFPPV